MHAESHTHLSHLTPQLTHHLTDDQLMEAYVFASDGPHLAALLLIAGGMAAFLAANKSKEGVVTLPSGLQYKILKEGSGPKPTSTDSVVCNYKGTLINGTEFDSSYKRGEPATFPVTGVIKGWTEALQLMPVGSKWQLFVPADLGYGPRGTPGGPIGPNATLIFEVELMSIKEKPPAPDRVPPPAAAPEKTPAGATSSPTPASPTPAPTPKQ